MSVVREVRLRALLTAVDDTDVHAEGLARKICHVAHIVTSIEYREEPVEYRRPGNRVSKYTQQGSATFTRYRSKP